MAVNIFGIIRKALLKEENDIDRKQPASRRADMELTNKFISNPEFPYLVSFSRTGSHWLRMMMELYLEKPSLKLLFFTDVEQAKDYSCYHTHDMDLQVRPRNVIYLYRNPVETIFSQMTYHEQDLTDVELVLAWADHYARHVKWWVLDEDFTSKKVILTYEGLKNDIEGEFKKISEFFGVPYDQELVNSVAANVSKEKISEKTKHDPKVINLDNEYSSRRQKFISDHQAQINSLILSRYPELQPIFKLQ